MSAPPCYNYANSLAAIWSINGIHITDSSVNSKANGEKTNTLVSCEDISISNSTVIANNTFECSYSAIYSQYNMTVTDGIVNSVSTGTSVLGTLRLTNSELITASNPSYWAIFTEHIIVTNSEVTANGGLFMYSSSGNDTSFSIFLLCGT